MSSDSLGGLGINLKQAFGLTESMISMHRDDNIDFESVGEPWPMNEVRISDKQEILEKINIIIREEEVLRLQGCKKGVIENEVKRILESEIEEGYRLVRPKAIYTVLKVKETNSSTIILDNGLLLNPGVAAKNHQGGEYLAIAMCTIGPALESRVAELFERKDFASALMLDSVGSVAVESAADFVNHLICHRAWEVSAKASRRLSPGYAGWSLNDQQVLFKVLPGARIGICLNEECVMIPRKSISFCVSLGKGVDGKEETNPCQHCGMKDCQYRRATILKE